MADPATIPYYWAVVNKMHVQCLTFFPSKKVLWEKTIATYIFSLFLLSSPEVLVQSPLFFLQAI